MPGGMIAATGDKSSGGRLVTVTNRLIYAVDSRAILAYAVFKIRALVVRLNPMVSDISRRLLPSSRRRRTRSRSSTSRGRPPTRPCLRARSRPARVRSLIFRRSCLARVAAIEMTASRKMPHESKYCSVALR